MTPLSLVRAVLGVWPRHCLMLAPVTMALAVASPGARAAEPDVEQLREATAKLIKLLVDQGVLTKEKADSVLGELARPAPVVAGAAAPPARSASAAGTVRVPYVPEFVRKEIKDELRTELLAQAVREGWAGPGAVPEWVRGLEFSGDLRLRAQADRFSEGNAPAVNVAGTNQARSLTLLNTTEDRERLRFRGRFGLTATVDENWSGGLRLSTGSATDPVSANQTLGTYNTRYVTTFDRAYVRYRWGDSFNVVGGRFGNPWYGSELVWANDLSFDGVAAQWTPRLADRVRGFATLAALPIQEVELSSSDKWLFGAQLGATLEGSSRAAGAKVGVAYYRYKGITGQVSPAGSNLSEFTAPSFTQKGNTYYNISSDPARPLLGLASEYRLVNVTGQFDMPVATKRVIVLGDYVRNIGFDRAAVSGRAGVDVEPKTAGYQVRVGFGDAEIRARNQWQVFVGYRRVERDAVLDAFTDSDFRLGGTDARGYILGASYGLGKNVAASFRLLSGDSISGPPLSVDVFQLDLNVRF